MKKIILSVIVAWMSLFGAVLPANAIPPIAIDQSNLLQTGWGWTAMSWDISQTFKPGMPVLTGVDIDLLTANPAIGDTTITVEIRKSGQLLATASRLVSVGFAGLLHFEFASEVPVTVGDSYLLHVAGSKDTFGWKYSSNTYPGGNRILGGTPEVDNDCLFQTYGRPAPFPASGQMQSNLGVYSLCQYENDWKPNICLQEEFDPYYDFWDTMNAGSGAPYADPSYSKRFQNNYVTLKRIIPVTGGTEKSWDDFHLVFFYGHNNTIVPPHPHEIFYYYNYEFNSQLGSNVWVSKNGYLDDIGWGYQTNYDYYVIRPINNANLYPGAVTYLYNQYTSSLNGNGYDYGGGVYWREHWNDPVQFNMYGRLGDKNLKWLILHGCQAVITANMDGSYNPLAYNIFSGVHGEYHIILGHYKSYYTSDLQKPLSEFANDLLAGVPIQHAYFDCDPDKNTSAIAAEQWSSSGTVDWPSSTMLNDKWNGTSSDNVGTNTFSMKWILPISGEGQEVQKMMVADSIDLRKIKIESKEARDLLNSESISYRARKTSFVPKGKLPVLKLVHVDDNTCKKQIQKIMRGHLLKESLIGEVQGIGGMYLSKTDSKSFWMHRASESYKYTETKQRMPIRQIKSLDNDRVVQFALDYVAKERLVNLVPGEEMDILFVSGVKNAVVTSKEKKPVEEFMSDYYVGFGRRFNGVPIIGSKLVIRFNGNGDVVMVNKNWRQIERTGDIKTFADQKSIVSNKTLSELIIRDPSFKSRHRSGVLKQKTISPKEVEVVEAQCGYMEAPVNYIQNSLRPGCNVRFLIGKERGETLPQIVLPIEEGGNMQKLWGDKYKVRTD